MAVAPADAAPMANPAIPCSERGVLKTRALPYFCCNPIEHLKTPPKATSSPNTRALSSVWRAMSMALLIAWNMFCFTRSPANNYCSSLRLFLSKATSCKLKTVLEEVLLCAIINLKHLIMVFSDD